jgi:hypothetical protein
MFDVEGSMFAMSPVVRQSDLFRSSDFCFLLSAFCFAAFQLQTAFRNPKSSEAWPAPP